MMFSLMCLSVGPNVQSTDTQTCLPVSVSTCMQISEFSFSFLSAKLQENCSVTGNSVIGFSSRCFISTDNVVKTVFTERQQECATYRIEKRFRAVHLQGNFIFGSKSIPNYKMMVRFLNAPSRNSDNTISEVILICVLDIVENFTKYLCW